MPDISIRDFSAFYKVKKEYYIAIDKINLEIRNGEFFCVLGRSGSGKSTLLKSLAGIIDLTQGEILSDNESIEKIDPKDRNISYVSQEYALYPHMTVYENIAYPLKLIHTSYEEMDLRVKEIAKELEIDWLLTRKPKQLSGGQQQRVALARALVKKPDLILLDEPFSNIERSLRVELELLLKNIHKKERQTIVFVTHDMTEAYVLADRMMVLEEGTIIEIGSPTEITENPKSDLVKEFLNGNVNN